MNDQAGFLKDVSDIIAFEAFRNPGLIPDLSRDKTLFLFSDYSRVHGHYKTYSFFVLGRSAADRFNFSRKLLRDEFHLGTRRMSFKGLNDRVKLKALPAFLSLAGAVNGFVVTVAVDSRIQFMFAEQFLQEWPELCVVKKFVLEDMLRVVHFGALALMTSFHSHQNIVWFTDNDSIVSNAAHEQTFGRIAEGTIQMMLGPDEKIGRVGFGATSADDGSLEIEDFASIPDLVAGALCEVLDTLARDNLRIVPKIVLEKPQVSKKSDLICRWIGMTRCPLKKFGIVFDKTGKGEWDWRPSFFRIENLERSACETRCTANEGVFHRTDPVRFDIADLSWTRILPE